MASDAVARGAVVTRHLDPFRSRVMIEIVATGPHASVQDLGRVGYAAWGIAGGGAADRGSLRLANRLVGNAESAAAFELLLAGATLRFDRAAVIAVTGATCPFTIDRTPGSCDGPQLVPAGAVVQFGIPAQRLRTYVAVRGGVATEPVLGSRATDELSGLGRALRAGDVVPIGIDAVGPPLVDVAPVPGWPSGSITLQGVVGPRDDWFTEESMDAFGRADYTVRAASDRVGIRLGGPRLLRRGVEAELLSEPTIRGAIEVPPDGRPIIFSADHPTTCGYPVVAVLDPPSVDVAAQCRPGQSVTFALVRLDTGPFENRTTRFVSYVPTD
jgi:biotin-dependent carboxylase-like uncharacterized protein